MSSAAVPSAIVSVVTVPEVDTADNVPPDGTSANVQAPTPALSASPISDRVSATESIRPLRFRSFIDNAVT